MYKLSGPVLQRLNFYEILIDRKRVSILSFASESAYNIKIAIKSKKGGALKNPVRMYDPFCPVFTKLY